MRIPRLLSCLLGLGFAALLTIGAAPAQADAYTATVLESSPNRVVIYYQFEDPTYDSVEIDGQKYVQLDLGGAPLTMIAGAPEVPNLGDSVIIADQGSVRLSVLDAHYQERPGLVPVPSKGNLLRTVNPADVPYAFGDAYAKDAYFPVTPAWLGDPYIQRDWRAVTITVHPVQSNPATATLRVYRDLTVEIVTEGTGGLNALERGRDRAKVDPSFAAVYRHHFLNYGVATQRYNPLDEIGSLLIICHDAWLPNIQPLVTHKISRGIPTTAVGVSTIGNNATAIKNYIQNLYNTTDLAYVLLVGDATQVATPTASGGSSDPTYSKLAGGDNYPDIMVGRFSAESPADVDTQVLRTIEYEANVAPMTDWFWRGVGIASSQGAGQGDEGQADYVHIDEIRTWLMGFGYTLVDQLYDTNTPSPNPAQVAAAVNAGRGIINYCGHGSTTSWSSSGFSNSDVNALVNDNMLPFIISVACVNGQFSGYTCFAEAWMRATNGTEPTGAIGIYASSINQSWAPPMEGQDEFNLLLVAEAYASYGALCFAGSCSMMDDYASGGVEMFDTWHVFGDPSLRVSVSCTSTGTVALDKAKYACTDTASLLVIDCDMNLSDLVPDSFYIELTSTSEPTPELVLVTENGPATGQFTGSIALDTVNSAGVLLVGPGDTVTATYIDADNGQGQYNVVVTSTAVVDCTPPVIGNVQALNVEPRSAEVTFDADEPVQGTVYYGESCGNLNQTAVGGGYGTAPVIALTGLQTNTTYFFAVQGTDEAGNSAYDDNGGACYTFTTPEVPDYFTEQDPADVDGLKLIFTPNGSNDFYQGCVEPITQLPTDPTGGTTVTLSDDDSESFTPPSAVSLYGVSYNTVHIGSNGYVTFTAGDTDYSETLADHFDTPRVAALFDDLHPGNGGPVSWKAEADHVAVTWQNVPEYSNTGSNTFQIELFYDGTITISYLGITCADFIAGLSAGNGLSPDFFMSDLSAMGSCGPRPPTASGQSFQTPVGTAFNVDLLASDDGLPDPPAMLSYIITALPGHGLLTDVAAGPITTVPYAMFGGGNRVTYTPSPFYAGPDSFQWKANDGGTPPDGGDSNLATVSITIGGPSVVFDFPLDTNPGWMMNGQWQFGVPQGLGGSAHGNPDPTSGATGANVIGVNLAGDYSTTAGGPYWVTMGPLDLSTATDVTLKFQRWLNTDYQSYVFAMLEVSNNGTTWTEIWDNGTSSITDSAWMPQEFDISDYADNQAAVYIRWGYQVGSGAFAYSGWNLDDIQIWGVVPIVPPVCAGDANCDGVVNWRDIDYFVAGMNDNEAAWQAMFGQSLPTCPFANNDVDGDGTVNWRDIDPLVAVMNTTCP